MEADRSLRARNWLIAAALLAVIVVAAAYFMNRKGDPAGDRADLPAPTDSVDGAKTGPDDPGAPGDPGGDSASETARRLWVSSLGFEPEWPLDLSAPQDCERVERDLQRLCVLIDSRPGVRDATRGYGSCDVLKDALDALAASRPDISSELRSYETMLRNVFYLSRVLGAEPLRMPRKLLTDHPELAEPAALSLYRFAVSRQGCVESTPVTHDALYDYGGFLFNTMGGQAYLRRRAPAVEGLACFYALQVVDSAQARGHNPAGIDPRPEIARCRSLLAGQSLVFSAEYEANLGAMAERWDALSR